MKCGMTRTVIPAKAGIHSSTKEERVDSHLHGNDIAKTSARYLILIPNVHKAQVASE